MGVHQRKLTNLALQRHSHLACPIQPAQRRHRKVPDLHSVKFHRNAKRNGGICFAIDVGREYMNVVPALRQRGAQAVNGDDRAAISHRGVVRGNDVQDPQGSPSQADYPW